jgi:hypothetical protein
MAIFFFRFPLFSQGSVWHGSCERFPFSISAIGGSIWHGPVGPFSSFVCFVFLSASKALRVAVMQDRVPFSDLAIRGTVWPGPVEPVPPP